LIYLLIEDSSNNKDDMSGNDNIEEILSERNIKLTATRILVFDAMRKFNNAFSLRDLEEALMSIDKSTISRTIHLFHENQLIHSFDDGSGSIKYSVCNTDCNCDIQDMHAHFYCNYCKKAFCLDDIPVPDFTLEPGMQTESVNLVIKGYCGGCKKIAT